MTLNPTLQSLMGWPAQNDSARTALIERAEKEGKWLLHHSSLPTPLDFYFSPSDLRKANANGAACYPAYCFKLVERPPGQKSYYSGTTELS